jgi:hypothetical protein
MSDVTPEHGFSVQGSEPGSPAERKKRELFLGYLDAVLNPKEMASRFAPDFWPHDLIPGDQRPPAGVGTEAMRGFRETINSAFTTVRSVEGTWIEDDTELSAVAGGADPRDLVGASMVVTYVHDGGPLTLPGVAVGEHAVAEAALVYEPSGKDVIVEVADVMRADDDGRVTDRWNRISMEDFIRQLDQNRKS